METIDKSQWTTHCLGRHLVQLPPDARVQAKFKVDGDELEWMKGFDRDNIYRIAAAREAELKSQKHETEGQMFLSRTEFDGDRGVAIVSWNRPFSKILKVINAYLTTSEPYRVFKYDGTASADLIAVGLRNWQLVATSLRSREEFEIPNDAGFCISGGFVAWSALQAESWQANVKIASRPGMELNLSAFVQGRVEKSLLERTGGFLGGLLAVASGTTQLRRGRHDVGPIQADEILIAGSEKGQQMYAFKWEAPGKANSLAEPNLNVALGVQEQTPPPKQPPFASDDDALALWDAVIDSIRLRPGAV